MFLLNIDLFNRCTNVALEFAHILYLLNIINSLKSTMIQHSISTQKFWSLSGVFKSFHLLKKSDARCRCRGRLSKLSVSTGPCIRVTFVSDFWPVAFLVDAIARGVLGVLMPANEVLDDGVRRGDGVPEIRSFCVASLLAAGDIVLRRSMVDLGDGLERIIVCTLREDVVVKKSVLCFRVESHLRG